MGRKSLKQKLEEQQAKQQLEEQQAKQQLEEQQTKQQLEECFASFDVQFNETDTTTEPISTNLSAHDATKLSIESEFEPKITKPSPKVVHKPCTIKQLSLNDLNKIQQLCLALHNTIKNGNDFCMKKYNINLNEATYNVINTLTNIVK
jgi:hypothetical protein